MSSDSNRLSQSLAAGTALLLLYAAWKRRRNWPRLALGLLVAAGERWRDSRDRLRWQVLKADPGGEKI